MQAGRVTKKRVSGGINPFGFEDSKNEEDKIEIADSSTIE
jgi:hypothetical protein